MEKRWIFPSSSTGDFFLPGCCGRLSAVGTNGMNERYTLDAATEFLLGKSVDTLENPQAEFSAAFAEVQRIQNMVSRIGPLNVFLPRKTFWAGLESINNFVNPFIDRALRLGPSILEENVKSAQGYNFLHALAGFTQDRKVLRDQIVAGLCFISVHF